MYFYVEYTLYIWLNYNNKKCKKYIHLYLLLKENYMTLYMENGLDVSHKRKNYI